MPCFFSFVLFILSFFLSFIHFLLSFIHSSSFSSIIINHHRHPHTAKTSSPRTALSFVSVSSSQPEPCPPPKLLPYPRLRRLACQSGTGIGPTGYRLRRDDHQHHQRRYTTTLRPYLPTGYAPRLPKSPLFPLSIARSSFFPRQPTLVQCLFPCHGPFHLVSSPRSLDNHHIRLSD